MEPGAETPNSPAQRMALPGFAFVTTPSPKRGRRRYVPVAVVSIVAAFLLYGVMDENHSARVNVAERAQVQDVRIDPDHLPLALVQYPATVTGQTSGGQKVRCTIRSLQDDESPSCAIPPSAVPHQQVRVEVPVSIAPPTSEVTPATHGENEARFTKKSPVAALPVKINTPPITTPAITTPPITTPPTATPVEDDHDGHHRHHWPPAEDNQGGDGHRALPGAIALTGSDRSCGPNKGDTPVKDDTKVNGCQEVKRHHDPSKR